MARARGLKPSFFTNDTLAELDPLARLLFQGLWCLADRRGRLEDRPRRIKAEILPYDACDCDAFLQALHASGFIHRYEADGRALIQVVNFEKHQNPHVREAESILPPPDRICARAAQAPDEHRAGTVPAPDGHGSGPADSGLPFTDSGLLTPYDCPEPNSGPPPEPPVIELPLSGGGTYGITPAQAEKWAGLYPSVPIPQELRNMLGWLDSNPRRRKTKTGILPFVTGWLAREQNKGGAGYRPRGQSPPHKTVPEQRYGQREYDPARYAGLTPEDIAEAKGL